MSGIAESIGELAELVRHQASQASGALLYDPLEGALFIEEAFMRVADALERLQAQIAALR